MSQPVVSNIVHSGATLWYAPAGETKPDETDVGYGADWGGNWERVGFTSAPLTVAYESTEADINVEEELAPVKRRRIGEALTWETKLAELTAAYLQVAASEQDTVTETAAASGQDAYEETGLGGVSVLAEKVFGVEGLHITSGAVEQPVRMFMQRGTAMINGNLEFSKKTEDYPGIPIQMKGLTDTSQDAGQKLMLWQRITGEQT